jgi:hypothetical protein
MKGQWIFVHRDISCWCYILKLLVFLEQTYTFYLIFPTYFLDCTHFAALHNVFKVISILDSLEMAFCIWHLSNNCGQCSNKLSLNHYTYGLLHFHSVCLTFSQRSIWPIHNKGHLYSSSWSHRLASSVVVTAVCVCTSCLYVTNFGCVSLSPSVCPPPQINTFV